VPAGKRVAKSVDFYGIIGFNGEVIPENPEIWRIRPVNRTDRFLVPPNSRRPFDNRPNKGK
jgi:hypothetical protein